MPDALSDVVAPPTDRVRAEWRARIAAEYTSATITQHLVLWLMQLGAPPDLLEAGIAIVGDELVHARMSSETYAAAGGTLAPAIDQAALVIAPSAEGLVHDVLRVAVQSFCLGETIAVPLFARLREGCTASVARVALDRILVDEVRHRDFGWDLLDWLFTLPEAPALRAQVAAWLPAMLAGLDASYGASSPTYAADDAVTDAEQAWGLAPTTAYAELLGRTVERDYVPRFAARDLDVAAAWASIATA